MVRRKRHEQIYPGHLAEIERLVGLLNGQLNEASIGLVPFREHYNALSDMRDAMRRSVNVLNGRPPDFIDMQGWR
ncbi:MAG: hypothetical protein WBA44_05195 [Mesorhizobium sp.]